MAHGTCVYCRHRQSTRRLQVAEPIIFAWVGICVLTCLFLMAVWP